MKKIFLLVVIAIAVSINGFSQTKRIAHRSHSGKDATLIMDGADNFGLPRSKKDTGTKQPGATDTMVKRKYIVMNKIETKPKIQVNKKASHK